MTMRSWIRAGNKGPVTVRSAASRGPDWASRGSKTAACRPPSRAVATSSSVFKTIVELDPLHRRGGRSRVHRRIGRNGGVLQIRRIIRFQADRYLEV
jgi:fatty acid-binding protein DegV